MRTPLLFAAGLAFLMPMAVIGATSATSVSSLKAKIAEAQKEVKQAQANFAQAKENACSGMPPADKAQWQQAETKFESLATGGGGPEQIAAQKRVVEGIETRVMKPNDRDDLDTARNKQTGALARLADAKAKLRTNTRGTDNHDESSQAIQRENRTQNGSNFSIRSERDAENHPPLP